MVISVTSFETSETHTVWVNGRPIHREEVTKVYVIEPLEQNKDDNAERTTADLAIPGWVKRSVWFGICLCWATWLYQEFVMGT
jgi:hypothetical protein